MQRAGVLVTQHSLLQIDVVFDALRIITNAILCMGDPRAYEENTWEGIPYREPLDKQPQLLTETWGHHFQYDGMRRTLMSMGLFGEAFWLVLARDRLAYPEALEVLHPAFMEVKDDKEGNTHYIYGTAMDRRELDPADVVHIPFMAMPQARRALSTVEYAGVAGALAMAAYEFGSSWFSQGASPSFILSTDQKLGREEVERIAQKFVIEHAGLQTAHMPLVIDSGLKADKVMASPDEAQYLQTLNFARQVIGSWFGVEDFIPSALEPAAPPPPHTGQERIQKLITFTLSGYTRPIEEALSACLPRGIKAGFETSHLSQLDAQFLAQEMMAVRQTQSGTPNDVRVRKLHWPPLDHPAADEPISPLASNVAPSQTQQPMGRPEDSQMGATDEQP